MEDYITKLKQFSKLDFQSKQEVITKGRPMISNETERLIKLRKDKDNFYKQVIDAFVQKERRMDLIYK